jgi:hypothetical protein
MLTGVHNHLKPNLVVNEEVQLHMYIRQKAAAEKFFNEEVQPEERNPRNGEEFDTMEVKKTHHSKVVSETCRLLEYIH